VKAYTLIAGFEGEPTHFAVMPKNGLFLKKLKNHGSVGGSALSKS